jgi:hypothetical protein
MESLYLADGQLKELFKFNQKVLKKSTALGFKEKGRVQIIRRFCPYFKLRMKILLKTAVEGYPINFFFTSPFVY